MDVNDVEKKELITRQAEEMAAWALFAEWLVELREKECEESADTAWSKEKRLREARDTVLFTVLVRKMLYDCCRRLNIGKPEAPYWAQQHSDDLESVEVVVRRGWDIYLRLKQQKELHVSVLGESGYLEFARSVYKWDAERMNWESKNRWREHIKPDQEAAERKSPEKIGPQSSGDLEPLESVKPTEEGQEPPQQKQERVRGGSDSRCDRTH